MKKFTGPVTAAELQYKDQVVSRAWRREESRILKPMIDALKRLAAQKET